MKKNVCRLLAALLCLTLAPFAALAEEADIGLRFDLTFQMDDAAYPQEDQALLEGVAELLNMMSLSGTLAVSAPSFDMQFDLMLEDSEETRTSFRLYGLDTHYQLESSLLGDQGLMMNNLALLEFAMKAYFHLDMPLQYVALLISPYAHTSAFDWVRQEWNGVMHAQEGDRVIPRDAVLELAAYMSENAEMDRAFSFWVQALTLDAGYSDSIFEAMYGLADWADGFLDEEGITVTVADGMETWTTGGETLFIREISSEGDRWSLTLPASLEGYLAQMDCSREGGNITWSLLCTDEEETTLLDAGMTLTNLPEALPFDGEAALDGHIGGDMLAEEVQWRWELASDDRQVTLRQVDAATQAPMLTISGTWEAAALDAPAYSPEMLDGVNIFSISDASLAELVHGVAEPFVKGMVPVLLRMPLSSYQSMFALLDQYGILPLLTSGLE